MTKTTLYLIGIYVLKMEICTFCNVGGKNHAEKISTQVHMNEYEIGHFLSNTGCWVFFTIYTLKKILQSSIENRWEGYTNFCLPSDDI